MTKIAKILSIGILIISISCSKEYSSPELRKNFTKEQISDFKKITEFFTQQICNNNQNLNFKSCFEKMLPELVEKGFIPILENIDFEKQKEMYNSISKSTFNEIWGFGKTIRYKDKKEYKSIGANMNGKYLTFLSDVGINNKYISEYAEMTYSIGDFESMSLLQNHIYNYPKDLDLNDINIQILISIHYLTQNDNEKRNEKWNNE